MIILNYCQRCVVNEIAIRSDELHSRLPMKKQFLCAKCLAEKLKPRLIAEDVCLTAETCPSVALGFKFTLFTKRLLCSRLDTKFRSTVKGDSRFIENLTQINPETWRTKDERALRSQIKRFYCQTMTQIFFGFSENTAP